MLNKLISKFKTPDVVTQNSAEAAASESISTPEKTASLLARLEVVRDAETKYSSRHQLLSKQHQQASFAAQRFQIEAERKRVAGAVQRDKATAEKSLDAANDQHAIATDNLKTAQVRHQDLAARLQPLEAEQKNYQQKVQERVTTANTEFSAAITAGDDAAEAAAAEKLFQAKMAGLPGASLSGPLALRIEALCNELQLAEDIVTVHEKAIDQATQARLKAKAELALVEYDRQAQALLEAYVAQRIAVSACGGVTIPGAGWVTDFRGRTVDKFDVQISSSERILLGARIDVYNNRHLPSHVVTGIIEAMTAPDLSIIAAKVEDLPNIPAEPVEVESPAFAVNPDGSLEDLTTTYASTKYVEPNIPADPVEVESPVFALNPDGSLKDLTTGYASMK